MALVIQTINATASYVPYERPPDPVALWTAIPRGLLSFIVAAEVLDLKPINDTFQLNVAATLPPQYAYVMTDCSFTLAGAIDLSKFDNSVNLNLQNFFRSNSPNLSGALSCNWRQDFFNTNLSNQLRVMQKTQDWPREVIIAPSGTSGVLTNFTATNQDAGATVAGTVDYYISFWQFDLEQIRKFPINSAVRTY